MNQQTSPTLTAARRAAIVDMLSHRGAARVAELAQRFAVDVSTIRRDLMVLERHGQVRRVHGGAVAVETAAPPRVQPTESSLGARIGRSVADLIASGETIFLGPGTLPLEVARCLALHRDLTVVTNSLEVAHWVAHHTVHTVIITGGQVAGRDFGLEGDLTRAALANLRADHVILELGGVSAAGGVTDDDLAQAEIARLLFKTGAEIIALVPPERVGRVAAAFVAPASDVDAVVTAREAASPFLWDLAELGVRLVLA